MRARLSAFVLLTAITATAACARAVSVASEPAPTYSLEVHNTLESDMIVTYDDGGGPRTLGTVAALRSERYIIAAPMSTTVDISAFNADRSVTFGPVRIDLSPVESRSVTIR